MSKLAGVDIVPVSMADRQLCVLLWGDAGVGKTTLACTAPGNKLILNFDPRGTDSVAGRADVQAADFSAASDSIIESVKSRHNPFNLKSVIGDYDTIIVDGLTNLQYMAVMHGIESTKAATVDNPTKQGYQKRNAAVLAAEKNIIRICQQHGKHVIFTAHAASPRLDDEGVIVQQTIALGGQLISQVPVDFSEVWVVADRGNRREILVRPAQFMRPCKTRMFNPGNKPSFTWTHTGDELTRWYDAWREAKWAKLALPK